MICGFIALGSTASFAELRAAHSIALTFSATSAGTHAVHTSGMFLMNHLAPSAPLAWFSVIHSMTRPACLQDLRRRILTEDLEPGIYLDEVEISETYGISRPPSARCSVSWWAKGT